MGEETNQAGTEPTEPNKMTKRNPVIVHLVTHPNRGTKKHKDKKKAAQVPTLREINNQLNDTKEN